ncbi:Gen1p [Perkinsus chesapeaki]|uniref:Gen1p n=1 Tax=Perkinsus chesapeaki TaxID=330153 RepID=A0A7J6M384_PERCH|nr:Gen1p [Perkinsus chesapeaki]
MGIKGLYEFLRVQAPSAIRECRPEEFAGKRLAIDASIWMYQFKNKIRYEDRMLTNHQGECTSGVHGFLHRTIKMLELGIQPIFVFDGHPPAMKYECLRQRRINAAKQNRSSENRHSPPPQSAASSEYQCEPRGASSKFPPLPGVARRLDFGEVHNAKGIDDASSPPSATSPSPPLLLLPPPTGFPRQLSNEEEYIVEVVKCLGCQYVIAPAEAEATCASLCAAGKADAVSTEDIDAIVFGAEVVLKNLSNTLHRLELNKGSNTGDDGNYVREISRSAVLDSLGLTSEALAELAILCGCDYCPSIPKIGPHRAHGLLLKHGSISAIVSALEGSKSYKAPIGWAYQEAKELFLKPSTINDLSPKPAVNIEGLSDLLINRLNYNPKRVETIRNRIKQINGDAPAAGGVKSGGKRQSSLLEFCTPLPKRLKGSFAGTPSTAAPSSSCSMIEIVELPSSPEDGPYSTSFII